MEQKRKANKPLTGLYDIFRSGKYTDSNIYGIIYIDPQYIDWCITKKIIVPSQEIKDELRKSKFLSQ